MDFLDNKTILLTGGTGSFGKKFTELVLKEHNVKSIRIFSRCEFKQFEMAKDFPSDKLRFLIGDVRDKDRLKRAMHNADIVVHAAALKQVPSCEYNPFEAVKTNILGSQNVIDAAIDEKVKKVMLVSSDKAVNPVNLYGATKMCAERIFIQGNVYAPNRETIASVVRYGNVMGSRGSVIPLFQKQKEQGVLTLTDKRMTRFWVTQEKAVRFVIYCLERMKGGEIFVPKLKSMRLVDLAKAIAPKAELKEIGIRPGEKINEVLLTKEEILHTKELDCYFVVEPEFPFWGREEMSGRRPEEGFQYSSGKNKQWLTEDDLREMLANL